MQATGFLRRRDPIPPAWSFLIGWAGMRGVVTLAAAFVIPEDAPHREVLLLVAFTVVAGTLLVQGLTLPLMTRLLDVPAPDPAEDALARAGLLQQAADAGFARLDELEYDDHHGVAEQVRARVDQRTFAAWEQLATTDGEETPSELYARIRGEMIEAERAKVLLVREQGQGAVGGREPGARHARHRGVDARRRLRGARRRTLRQPRLRRRPHLRRPRRAPRRRHGRPSRPAPPAWPTAPAGCRCGSASPAATWAAATPPSASTPPPTSTTACTRWWSPPSGTSRWRWCYVHNLTG